MNIHEAREIASQKNVDYSDYLEGSNYWKAVGFIEGYESGVRVAEKLVHDRRYKTSMHLSDAILALLGEGK